MVEGEGRSVQRTQNSCKFNEQITESNSTAAAGGLVVVAVSSEALFSEAHRSTCRMKCLAASSSG